MTMRTPNIHLAAALVLLGSISFGEAHAGARDGEGESGENQRQSCPEVFGTPETRSESKLFRKRVLHWVVEEPSGITVVHSHQGWEDVTRFKFPGVELLGRSQKGEGVAVVKISEELADSFGCPAGSYQVRRDDALGGNSRVLAIFRDAVLIVHEGQLGYMATKDHPPITWLVAWKLPGVTVYPHVRGGGGHQRKRPPPKRRKKAKPRRRKR
jgi:hypothetical protein